MKLKINSIETRTGAKGDYSYGQATILKKDGSERNTVVMAFGAQRDAVKKYLKAGRTVEVTAVFDGGVLKILGGRDGAVKAAAAA